MKIKINNNNDYLRKILSIKLNISLTKFNKEKYFIIQKNNILYGIARIVKLTEKELTENKQFQIYKLDNNIETFFLNGIWVHEDYRNQGYGKKFVYKRLQNISNNSQLITDVYKTSNLINFYENVIFMNRIFEDNNIIFLKK